MSEIAPLQQRLRLMRDIAARADISAAAKLICYLLLIERMNADNGDCFCSNRHIARELGLDLATVKRAKTQLYHAAILHQPTRAQNAPTSNQNNQTTYYRFNTGSLALQNAPTLQTNCAQRKMRPAQNAPATKHEHHHQNQQAQNAPARAQIAPSTPRRPRHGDRIGEKIYAGCIRGAESAELRRADLDHVRTTGRSLPRDRHGGWLIDARYFETLQ